MISRKEFLKGFISPHPHECCLCQEERVLGEDGLCNDCRENIRLAVNPAPAFPLDGVTCGLLYTDEIAHAFYRFKKEGETWLAGFFAQYMSVPAEWKAELLVPVPLHPIKEWGRTYNQSHLLALYLSSACHIPVCAPLLRRTRYTTAQKSKSASERKTALRGAFTADKACEGRRIILIDDVITTGSTISACAKALKKAGAERVYAVSAASVYR